MQNSKEERDLGASYTHQKTILKNRFFYLLASVGGHLYVFLTLPMLTRKLSNDEFGFYIILIQIITLFQSAALVLFSSALLRFYVEFDEKKRKEFISSIFTFFIVLQIISVALLALTRSGWMSALYPNVNLPIDPIVLAALAWMLLTSLKALITSLCKTMEQPILILSQSAIYGFFLVLFLYGFVYLKNQSLLGVIKALIFSDIAVLAFLFYKLRKNFSFVVKAKYLKRIVSFSAPIALSSILFIVFGNVDRVVLSHNISLSDLGAYGLAFTIGNIAGLVNTANFSAYSPRLLKVLRIEGREAALALCEVVMKNSISLMSLSVVGITALNDVFLYYFGGNEFSSTGSIIVMAVAAGHLARTQFLFVTQWMFSHNKTVSILYLHIALLLLGLFFSVVLVNIWGVNGVAFMFFLSYVFIIPISFWALNKNMKIRPQRATIIRSFTVLLFIAVCEIYLSFSIRNILSVGYWLVKLVEVTMSVAIFNEYIFLVIRQLGRKC